MTREKDKGRETKFLSFTAVYLTAYISYRNDERQGLGKRNKIPVFYSCLPYRGYAIEMTRGKEKRKEDG